MRPRRLWMRSRGVRMRSSLVVNEIYSRVGMIAEWDETSSSVKTISRVWMIAEGG
jgi:hypothetical protein